MKHIYKFLISILFLISITRPIRAQWIPIVNTTNKTLHSIQFINSTTGFSCGDSSVVLKTTTAGTIWTSINGGVASNITMTDIHFLDINTGYCTGGIGSISGRLYKTTNGGANWVQRFDTTGAGFRSVFFINANTGWAAGSNGLVKYTSSGGASWFSRNINISSLIDIRALSPDTVFAAGFGSGGSIIRSTNAGINWTFMSVPNDMADCRFVIFANSNTGYTGGLASGGFGAMAKTTDRGSTWVRLNSYSGVIPHEGAVINSQLVYVVRTDDTVSLTTNGGTTWLNQFASVGGTDRSISINSGFACIAGRDLAVNATVGIQALSGEVPMAYKLHQNFPNPFNPSTVIKFDLPYSSDVEISVFNSLGKQVSMLVKDRLSAGSYSVEWNAAGFSSGMYFYSIRSGGFTKTNKMILMK